MAPILNGMTKKDARLHAWHLKTLTRYILQVSALVDNSPEIIPGLTSQENKIISIGNTILINPILHKPHDKGEILAETIERIAILSDCNRNDLTAKVLDGIFNQTFRQ
jgi:hypothetical protein